MTFKELKAAVKGRFMKWGKYTAEKLENVSGIFESTTTEDIGKVLTVGDDGSPEWGEAVNPLPPVTSEDNGDVLSVVNGAWAKEPAPSSLPPYTSADKGKGLFLGDGEGTVEEYVVPLVSDEVIDLSSLMGQTAHGFIISDYNKPFFDALQNGDTISCNWKYIDIVDNVEREVSAEVACNTLLVPGSKMFISADSTGTNTLIYANDTLAATFEGALGTTATFSATASVPSVEPKWENAGVTIIHCTGTAQVGAQSILVPTDTTLNDVLKCLVNAENNDNRFTKPVYVNLPDVNTVTGVYSYADHSYMALASLDAIRGTAPIFETTTSSYTLYPNQGTGALYVVVASK